MTNREYITSIVARFGLSESDVNLILFNHQLDEEETAVVDTIKKVLYDEFSSLIPLANVSEEGFSQSWNMQAVKLWYSLLAKDLGLPNILSDVDSDNEVNDCSYFS